MEVLRTNVNPRSETYQANRTAFLARARCSGSRCEYSFVTRVSEWPSTRARRNKSGTCFRKWLA